MLALNAAALLALHPATRIEPMLSRRGWLGGAAACAAGAVLLPPAPRALAATPTASAKVTDRVLLEFVQQLSAEDSQTLPLTIGLFGSDAPDSVAAFKQLVAGSYMAPCTQEDEDDGGAMEMERSKSSRKAQYKQCRAGEGEPVAYAGSGVWRIVSGSRIDAGALRGKWALRRPPMTPADESSTLSHDAAGLLSVRRGGGTFDFGLTSSADPKQDADFVVIGRVMDDKGLSVVAALDAMPVVRAAAMMGQGDGASASRESACAYGSPNSYCSQNKPLKKITLARASIL